MRSVPMGAFVVFVLVFAAARAHALPPQLLFRPPDTRQAVVSPDGSFVAMLRGSGRRTNKIFVHHAGLDATIKVSHGINSIDEIKWADSNTLLALRSPTSYIFEVAIEDGELTYREQPIERSGFVVDALPNERGRILYATRGDVSRVHRLRLDALLDGSTSDGDDDDAAFEEVVAELEHQVARWVADAAGEVRAALSVHTDPEPSVKLWYRDSAQAPWRVLHERAADDPRVIPMGFSGPRNLLVASDEGRDTFALYEFDPATAKTTSLIYEHPTAQVLGVVFDYSGRELLGVAIFESGERVHRYLDPATQRFQQAFEKTFPGERAKVTSLSRDRKQLTALVSSPRNPGVFYLFDPDTWSAKVVGRVAPDLHKSVLAETEVFTVESRDGTRVEGFLTRPLRLHRPALVVMPHGGPVGVRDERGFDPVAQYLASTGFAVLRVNYRGSSGYGRSFLDAARRQWGTGIEEDIDAAVQHVIDSGAVDPSRMCIAGSSYGGYSALMSVIRRPGRYRCAATHAGVTDIGLLFNSSDFAMIDEVKEWYAEMVGDPDEESALLRSLSPAYLVEQIEVPVHVAHGTHDARVDVDHAFRLKLMLELHDKEFEWQLLEGFGHSFPNPASTADYYEGLRGFVWKHTR